jgi:hypothetical protein
MAGLVLMAFAAAARSLAGHVAVVEGGKLVDGVFPGRAAQAPITQ